MLPKNKINRMKRYISLFLVPILAMATIGAVIYKWVDEKGVTQYTQTPPPKKKAQEIQVRPATPDAGMEGSSPKAKSWQQDEIEFKQRREDRERAEAQEAARKKAESTEWQSNCKKSKDELARLLAIAPMIKGRHFVPSRDPAPGEKKWVGTMDNAERSIRIKTAEEDIKKWCN